jgi:hypothetical protein
MLMLSCAVAVWGGDSESATCTVKMEVPLPEGVPVMAPVLLFKFSPAGKLPSVIAQV